ncbi:MAG: ASPIC/UnbV domain-containing protein [Planctomycetota bacterium]|nr:ASPIC/UnbV domain-containing protein [Planctomycetota bacterium]
MGETQENDKRRFLADIHPANQMTGDTNTRVLLSKGAQSQVLYRENTQSMEIDLTSLPGMRESQSNCGYLGQNDPVLHFGLGQHASVDVMVKFVDGTTARISRVSANQTILISGSQNR